MATNDERPVVMTIPEDMMRAQIQAAVVSALSAGKPERFIDELVRTVLQQKADNYGRDTILDKTVAQMIKKVAEEYCQEYVEGLKPQIRAAVEARLKKQKNFAIEIADKLVEAVTGNIHASINISVNSENRRY